MKQGDFINEVKKAYNDVFQHSAVSISRGCLTDDIFIQCYLAKDKTEFHHGISQNDMLSIRFLIEGLEEEIDKKSEHLPEKIVLIVHDKTFRIKPTKEYYAFSRKSISFRKTKGTPEKIIKTLERYFRMLKSELQKSIEADEIHESFIDLLTKKLI